MHRSAALAALLLCSACAHAPESSAPPPCPYASEADGTQSVEILCREPLAVHVKVKHVLLGWKALATPERAVDPRAAERTQAQAESLAKELLRRVRAGEAIEPLMAEHSEDPGSAQSGRFYEASPDAALVPSFKALAVRLQVGEAGIVKSAFGLHVIQRVP